MVLGAIVEDSAVGANEAAIHGRCVRAFEKRVRATDFSIALTIVNRSQRSLQKKPDNLR